MVIPQNSAIIVPGRYLDSIFKQTSALLEATQKLIDKHEVLVVKCVINPSMGTIPLRFLNISESDYKLHDGTIVATIQAVEECSDYNTHERAYNVSEIKVDESESRNENELPESLRSLYERSNSNLDQTQCEALENLLTELKDTFPHSSNDLGRTSLVKHQTNNGQSRRVKQPPRRVSLACREEVDKEIEDMRGKGVIRESDSAWCLPAVVIKKKQNSLRFCLQFPRLNDVTIRDIHPIPRIDTTLDALSRSTLFSTLDLKSCYWQVEADPKDRPKTAFTVQGEVYGNSTLCHLVYVTPSQHLND